MYTIEPLDYQEEVQVIRYNKDLDMAMLRSAKSNLKWLNVFKAQSIGSFVNKAVLAIGYPQDIYPANVSLGFVMSISPDLIRTSAPQFFGNSGGPIILFGTSEVIGITQWITYMNGMPRSNQVFGHNYLAIHRFLIG
jgi:S1-C subfamily serine protease